MEYQTPVDIGNRALQQCGATRMDTTLGFSEVSRGAGEVSACYGKIRQAELRTNVWTFACKRAAIRSVDTDTMLLVPALWVAGTTYFVGSIVADSNGNPWISRIPDNLGYQPGVIWSAWEPYFGPLTVNLYDSTTTYYAGELVYTADGDGTSRVYVSLVTNNEDDPETATAWAATTTYKKNDVITYSSVAYMSLVDLNLNQQPDISASAWTTTFTGGSGSVNWRQIGGAEFSAGVGLTTLNIIYPLESGPASQPFTRNIFKLPANFLRFASQQPGSAIAPALGGPSGITYRDWAVESGFITTADTGPIILRFVGDVQDVSQMDPMFCEGFAARIGMEICDTVTQSNTQRSMVAKIYDEWISRAKVQNAIEQGSDEPPDDDWITVRA